MFKTVLSSCSRCTNEQMSVMLLKKVPGEFPERSERPGKDQIRRPSRQPASQPASQPTADNQPARQPPEQDRPPRRSFVRRVWPSGYVYVPLAEIPGSIPGVRRRLWNPGNTKGILQKPSKGPSQEEVPERIPQGPRETREGPNKSSERTAGPDDIATRTHTPQARCSSKAVHLHSHTTASQDGGAVGCH